MEIGHYSIHIFAPGHPQGHGTGWFWEVRSTGDVVDCGQVKPAPGACDEAYENAGMALGQCLKKTVLKELDVKP
jgi:hypothetical protein